MQQLLTSQKEDRLAAVNRMQASKKRANRLRAADLQVGSTKYAALSLCNAGRCLHGFMTVSAGARTMCKIPELTRTPIRTMCSMTLHSQALMNKHHDCVLHRKHRA